MTRLATPSTEVLATLSRLVGFPTVSRDSNLDLIDSVRAELEPLGARCRVILDGEGRKANLLASFGSGEGGLVFSGHTDVVPIDGQAWTSNPFVLTERGNRLYGRGTADMKGFIALVLATAPQMAASGRSFHIALSYDEEVGCIGARSLVQNLIQSGVRLSGCVIGEPTGLKPVIGHKGASAYVCEVRGREAHSSLAPEGVNAIEYAARLIEKLRLIGERFQAEERRHDGFDIPFTTINTGVISGGLMANIVPAECAFRFDIRRLPWTRAEDVIAELEAFVREALSPLMQVTAPEAGIVFRQIGSVPAFDMSPDDPFVRQVERAAFSNGSPGYVAFGTEAGLFQAAGIPTVVCGPGSIEQAHKPDEFITLDQLARGEAFVRRLVDQANDDSAN